MMVQHRAIHIENVAYAVAKRSLYQYALNRNAKEIELDASYVI